MAESTPPLPPLIDVGVNLTHRRFQKDLPAVLDRARAARITHIVVTGTNPKESRAALTLATAHPELLRATAGCHPHDASRFSLEPEAGGPSDLETLRTLIAEELVVAIGECGLDFDRDFSPRPVQEAVFEAQVRLAIEAGAPLFLHERAAHARFIDILTRNGPLPPAVVHCFTGSGEDLDRYLAEGLYIGITGFICDERRGTHLLELVRRIPSDRLVIETDAPFLTPRDLRPKPKGGRNEPSTLPHICRTIARARGEDANVVARATTENARRLFGM